MEPEGIGFKRPWDFVVDCPPCSAGGTMTKNNNDTESGDSGSRRKEEEEEEGVVSLAGNTSVSSITVDGNNHNNNTSSPATTARKNVLLKQITSLERIGILHQDDLERYGRMLNNHNTEPNENIRKVERELEELEQSKRLSHSSSSSSSSNNSSPALDNNNNNSQQQKQKLSNHNGLDSATTGNILNALASSQHNLLLSSKKKNKKNVRWGDHQRQRQNNTKTTPNKDNPSTQILSDIRNFGSNNSTNGSIRSTMNNVHSEDGNSSIVDNNDDNNNKKTGNSGKKPSNNTLLSATATSAAVNNSSSSGGNKIYGASSFSSKSSSSSFSSGSSSSSILYPHDLKEENVQLGPEKIEELFVEMCFFARLGFVQPPRCLKCTYEESMEGKKPNKKCQRLVVWRKDAQTLLHPNHLDGNILLVECHVARSLLGGKKIENHKWDNKRKQVVIEPQQ